MPLVNKMSVDIAGYKDQLVKERIEEKKGQN